MRFCGSHRTSAQFVDFVELVATTISATTIAANTRAKIRVASGRMVPPPSPIFAIVFGSKFNTVRGVRSIALDVL